MTAPLMTEPAREKPGISFPIRLNRYISACGVASRRKADELIAAGRVSVDGVTECSLGRVLEGASVVCVDGLEISAARLAYIVMNKPRGIVSAASDARERTVLDLLPEFYRPLGLFPVGRLDKESEGLIVLTNDGIFAQDILHPSKGVRRTYLVWLKYDLPDEKLAIWRRGLDIEGRLMKPLDVQPEPAGGGRLWRVALGEGYKREIRLMAIALGNRVARLRRIGIGGLFLKKLPVGTFCEYNCSEIRDMIEHGGVV